MKLREILTRVSLTSSGYDGLVRQNAVLFMQHPSEEDGERFGREHLLAMFIFRMLRDYGLKPALAGQAVAAAYPLIADVTWGRLLPSHRPKAGISMVNMRGRIVTVPLEEADSRDNGDEVARLEVDVKAALQVLNDPQECLPGRTAKRFLA